MSKILCLETATKNCSVALFEDDKLISVKEEYNDSFSHSEKLTLFIEEILSENSLNPADLDAVAVSKGPGSYTGLRIGVAVAKGMAFALKIPMLSVSTNEVLFEQIRAEYSGFDSYYPMIDAKRMEVFTCCISENGVIKSEISAEVIDKDSFQEKKDEKLILFGDGADKFVDLFEEFTNIQIISGVKVSAKGMGNAIYKKFVRDEFEDVAYFEPFYLKEFIAGKMKKIF